jgi:hypothetical protein
MGSIALVALAIQKIFLPFLGENIKSINPKPLMPLMFLPFTIGPIFG